MQVVGKQQETRRDAVTKRLSWLLRGSAGFQSNAVSAAKRKSLLLRHPQTARVLLLGKAKKISAGPHSTGGGATRRAERISAA